MDKFSEQEAHMYWRYQENHKHILFCFIYEAIWSQHTFSGGGLGLWLKILQSNDVALNPSRASQWL